MANPIIIEIPQAPVPKASYRPNRKGGGYYPGGTKGWMDHVSWMFKQQKPRGFKKLMRPVRMDIYAYFPIPKKNLYSYSPGDLHCQGKGEVKDRDNIEKGIQDALEKSNLYENDNQICMGETVKRWCSNKKHPKGYTVIVVTEMNEFNPPGDTCPVEVN